MKNLTEKQRAYYDERVAYYHSLICDGIKIAVPTGLFYNDAIKMTDKQCEEWLAVVERTKKNPDARK